MDPLDPSSYNHRIERLSTGRTYHFVDQVPFNYDPATTLTLLCIHGFPDLWYGWRYMIAPWVQTFGWRVVVPDMLGYGGTDKPTNPEHYTTKALGSDLCALLDLIGVQKAVIIGHDWGSTIAWRFALWHPDRVRALVPMSVPYTPPRTQYVSLEKIVELYPAFGYMLYLSGPSSTNEIEKNLQAFFKALYSTDPKNFDHKSKTHPINWDQAAPLEGSKLLTAKEHAYYLDNFKAGGMNGPLNYYRTTESRFVEELDANLRLPGSPVLFIWGDADPICSPYQVERMHKAIRLFRDVRLIGKGHWLAVECKDAVIESVAEFLQGLGSIASKL